MLRNRSRAVTKQPLMADQSSSLSSATTQNPNSPNTNRTISSFLGSPRFFNGLLSPKNLCDVESSAAAAAAAIMSPTSILDTKQFPNFGNNPFGFNKNPIKPTKEFQEIKPQTEKFDSETGIALALVEEKASDSICKPSNSRNVLFGTKLRIQIPQSTLSPNGSPESPGDFGIKTRNSQFPGTPTTATGFGSPRAFSPGPLSLSEMELSEEYTRVISRGPNPKTTHIYDNCVVESCCGVVGSPDHDPKSPCESFMSSCQTCKKNLGHGSDIFIYRGEKAFCSEECRCQEMLLDEMMNT